VDVEPHSCRLGVDSQTVGTSGVAELGPLVSLRVAEEELHVRCPARLRLGDRVGLLDVGSERWARRRGTHLAIVGTGSDTTSPGARWQAGRMDVVVLIVLILVLLGIVAAAVMTIGGALDRRKTG